MTRTTLRLVGLEADNLLAFLALLGTLRALEEARPEWQPRCRWSGPPWHPELDLPNVETGDVLAAIAEGVAECARDVEFGGHDNIDFTQDAFKTFARAATESRHRSLVAAALGSDGAVRGKEERIEPTPLAAIAGQGHQHFLARVVALGRKPLGEILAVLGDALLRPWTYADLEHTLRWDPLEDRRYALGFADPSGERIRTSAGANILAAVGFPLLTTAPGAHYLLTTACRRDGRVREVRWPIWTRACCLAAVRAMLRSKELVDAQPKHRLEWQRRGVVDIRRSSRVQAGKYFNFTRAASIWTD